MYDGCKWPWTGLTIDPQGYVLVPLQIENDTQILQHSHYNNMEEFVEYVEHMYPKNKILEQHKTPANNITRTLFIKMILSGDLLRRNSYWFVINQEL